MNAKIILTLLTIGYIQCAPPPPKGNENINLNLRNGAQILEDSAVSAINNLATNNNFHEENVSNKKEPSDDSLDNIPENIKEMINILKSKDQVENIDDTPMMMKYQRSVLNSHKNNLAINQEVTEPILNVPEDNKNLKPVQPNYLVQPNAKVEPHVTASVLASVLKLNQNIPNNHNVEVSIIPNVGHFKNDQNVQQYLQQLALKDDHMVHKHVQSGLQHVKNKLQPILDHKKQHVHQQLSNLQHLVNKKHNLKLEPNVEQPHMVHVQHQNDYKLQHHQSNLNDQNVQQYLQQFALKDDHMVHKGLVQTGLQHVKQKLQPILDHKKQHVHQQLSNLQHLVNKKHNSKLKPNVEQPHMVHDYKLQHHQSSLQQPQANIADISTSDLANMHLGNQPLKFQLPPKPYLPHMLYINPLGVEFKLPHLPESLPLSDDIPELPYLPTTYDEPFDEDLEPIYIKVGNLKKRLPEVMFDTEFKPVEVDDQVFINHVFPMGSGGFMFPTKNGKNVFGYTRSARFLGHFLHN